MRDYSHLFGDFLGQKREGSTIDDLLTGRMVPPKDEHLLSYEAKVANRIRVNEYILRSLRGAS